ncbi:hypothetical protein F4780DRAFT_286668 [Xylariomycetidae sp. FL0641]|nr:hypothetical protein F4780DRAFT_286668 [Xylariomycetidae sp. FL0641]
MSLLPFHTPRPSPIAAAPWYTRPLLLPPRSEPLLPRRVPVTELVVAARAAGREAKTAGAAQGDSIGIPGGDWDVDWLNPAAEFCSVNVSAQTLRPPLTPYIGSSSTWPVKGWLVGVRIRPGPGRAWDGSEAPVRTCPGTAGASASQLTHSCREVKNPPRRGLPPAPDTEVATPQHGGVGRRSVFQARSPTIDSLPPRRGVRP